MKPDNTARAASRIALQGRTVASAGARPAKRPAAVAGTAGRPARRWTVNGDFLTLQPNGVARYAREVTLALDRLCAEGHPLAADLDLRLVAPRPGGIALDAIPMEVVPEFRRPRLPQFWVQAQLPRHVAGGLLSLCNLAPLAVRRQIVCIHDLQTRTAPESYGRLFRLLHDFMLPRLGRRAARITTVSGFSRDQIVRFGVAPAEKVRVAYNGSDHAARWNAAAAVLPEPRRPYVLCLGRNEAHKNIGLMVRLAPLLDGLGLDLWIAGAVDREILLPDGGELGPNVRLLGRIGDDELGQALSGALCFLFPSRTEGFGLPMVEAMTRGCPVVASTASCLREVGGDAALYGDPDDPAAWCAEVKKLASSPAFRAERVAAGYKRAADFTWRRTAIGYLELMREIDDEADRGGARGRSA